MTGTRDRDGERDEIIRLAKELLLGPREQDETIQSAPADTYLTGILWPTGAPLGSMEDEENDGAPVNDDGETDAGIPGYRTVRPCSVGLTFAAAADAAIVVSLAATARYVPEEREAPEGRRTQRHWRRVPLGYSYEMPAGEAGAWSTQEFRDADGARVSDPEVRLHIRRRIDGDRQVVTATLVNEAVERDDRLRDECCLFQTGLEVRAVDRGGAGAIRPRPAVLSASDDEDVRSAALLYRDVVEYAVGHGVAAEWKSAPATGVDHVATTWLPSAKVKGTSAAAHTMLAGFLKDRPKALDASWLAREDDREEITRALGTFVAVYGRWIDETLEEGREGIPTGMRDAADLNLERCRTACRRMREGVAVLEQDDSAWQAFALANAAMDRQARYKAKRERRGPLTWRPFQLAYMVLVVPGLVRAQTQGPQLSGPALVPNRRRQDGSLPRPDSVPDLPAAACGRWPSPARRRGRADALHAAAAHRAAVPARRVADLRLRRDPPRTGGPRRGADLPRPLRRGRGHAEPGGRSAGGAPGRAPGPSAALDPPPAVGLSGVRARTSGDVVRRGGRRVRHRNPLPEAWVRNGREINPGAHG